MQIILFEKSPIKQHDLNNEADPKEEEKKLKSSEIKNILTAVQKKRKADNFKNLRAYQHMIDYINSRAYQKVKVLPCP